MTIFLSTLTAFSLQSGLSLWIMLEVNFLSFVGLLSVSPAARANSSLNYFLVQALGSSIMLISLMLLLSNFNSLYDALFFYALIMKLGGAPFHSWYLTLIQKLSWNFIWLLACWQKIIPLIIVSLNLSSQLSFITWATVLVGGLGTIKQSSVKKIFAFSSIFTLGWILAAMLIAKLCWWSFFWGYALGLGSFVMCISSTWPMDTKNESAHYSLPFMILLFIMLLTMTGIPPFLGFFLKLFILNQIMMLSATLALALVTLSLLMIAAYLSIMFSLLTLMNSSSLNLIGSASEKTLTFEFILLNSTFSVLFLNYSMCNMLHK